MSANPKKLLTPQEYLARERLAEFRSEYYRGEVFAMAGASWEHTLIKDNLAAESRGQLKQGPCHVLTSDMRVKISGTGLYTYPDIAIVCDKPQFEDGEFDTLLNPRALVEVLSDSTEKYDRGAKFAHYRQIPSLQEYVLVSQDRVLMERDPRCADGSWVLTVFADVSLRVRVLVRSRPSAARRGVSRRGTARGAGPLSLWRPRVTPYNRPVNPHPRQAGGLFPEPLVTPTEVLALIREKEVRAVDLRFMDFPGLWQHFTIPAEALDEARLRGGPRLRRLQHPRLAGDQRVRHARRARRRHRVHRSVLQRQDADAALQHPGPADQGRLHARPAQRGPQGRQLHEVDRHRRHRLFRPRAGVLRLRRRPLRPDASTPATTTSTASRGPGTPAGTRSRTSATSCATRKAISPARRPTPCTTCAPR